MSQNNNIVCFCSYLVHETEIQMCLIVDLLVIIIKVKNVETFSGSDPMRRVPHHQVLFQRRISQPDQVRLSQRVAFVKQNKTPNFVVNDYKFFKVTPLFFRSK